MRSSSLLHVVLKQCGDNLTRENVMKQAASLKGVRDADAAARHQGQHQRDGLLSDPVGAGWRASRARTWELFGEIISNEAASQ